MPLCSPLILSPGQATVSNRVAGWLLLRGVPEMTRNKDCVNKSFLNRWVVLSCLDTVRITEDKLAKLKNGLGKLIFLGDRPF